MLKTALIGFSGILLLSTTIGFSPDSDSSIIHTLRGESGKLTAAISAPDTTVVVENIPGLKVHFDAKDVPETISNEFKAPSKPGWYQVALEHNGMLKAIDNLRLITLVPFTAKVNGSIGKYFMGAWPFEKTPAPSAAYIHPAGFIEVTFANINEKISEHFRIADFVDKDQANVWPKYMSLSTKLVDKLELVIDELNREGYHVKHLSVLCGFRSPNCNATFGDPRGRGKLSRHMYGDAADVFVDNPKTGWTADINGDGKVDIKDAMIIAHAAEVVELNHPSLIGGIGIYPGTSSHGPFVHVDVRGQKARWNG